MQIRLFEHTEYTGYADSWLRIFTAYCNTQALQLQPDNFVYVLKVWYFSTISWSIFTTEHVPFESYLRQIRARYSFQCGWFAYRDNANTSAHAVG